MTDAYADDREAVYAFTTGDQMIYVDAAPGQAYDTFRLLIGRPGAWREVPVLGVERRRDGGTTWVRTAEGELFVPSKLRHPPGNPTWRGVAVQPLSVPGVIA